MKIIKHGWGGRTITCPNCTSELTFTKEDVQSKYGFGPDYDYCNYVVCLECNEMIIISKNGVSCL